MWRSRPPPNFLDETQLFAAAGIQPTKSPTFSRARSDVCFVVANGLCGEEEGAAFDPKGTDRAWNKYARQRTRAKILTGKGWPRVSSVEQMRTGSWRKGICKGEQMLIPRPNSAERNQDQKSNHDKPGPPPLQTFIDRRVGDPDQWGYLK
jgi:hypothetical protein